MVLLLAVMPVHLYQVSHFRAEEAGRMSHPKQASPRVREGPDDGRKQRNAKTISDDGGHASVGRSSRSSWPCRALWVVPLFGRS